MLLLFFDGFDFANLLVKTREGRPIKIDNNTFQELLLLMQEFMHRYCRYDNMRLKEPKIEGKIQLGQL
jgi:molybdopterin-containing oxidoreductase family iron-sulfur binding subunit